MILPTVDRALVRELKNIEDARFRAARAVSERMARGHRFLLDACLSAWSALLAVLAR